MRSFASLLACSASQLPNPRWRPKYENVHSRVQNTPALQASSLCLDCRWRVALDAPKTSNIFISVQQKWILQSSVQHRKWSPTANDPQTGNDPGPSRKWSPMWTASDPAGKRGVAWSLVPYHYHYHYYCYSETFKLGFLVFSTSSLVVSIRYCPLYCL